MKDKFKKFSIIIDIDDVLNNHNDYLNETYNINTDWSKFNRGDIQKSNLDKETIDR